MLPLKLLMVSTKFLVPFRDLLRENLQANFGSAFPQLTDTDQSVVRMSVLQKQQGPHSAFSSVCMKISD
jgi:hypothetical protein